MHGQAGSRRARVRRHRHDAEAELRAVRQRDPDAVARGHPERPKVERRDELAQGAVREREAAIRGVNCGVVRARQQVEQ